MFQNPFTMQEAMNPNWIKQGFYMNKMFMLVDMSQCPCVLRGLGFMGLSNIYNC
jgi:hypothetical protein